MSGILFFIFASCHLLRMCYSNIRYALCYTPVYRNAISVVYLVLTILQINSSSSIFTEYHRLCNRGKSVFDGSPNTELSHLRCAHFTYKTVDAVVLHKIPGIYGLDHKYQQIIRSSWQFQKWWVDTLFTINRICQYYRENCDTKIWKCP